MGIFNMTDPTMWIILFVLFIIVEVATAGGLISIWFCIGAVAGFFAAKAGATLFVQFLIFMAVSIILLVVTKPFLKKVMKQKSEATNLDSIVGRTCIVVEDIDNELETGAIKIDGKVWTARNHVQNEKIQSGDFIKIIEIQGVKAIVERK